MSDTRLEPTLSQKLTRMNLLVTFAALLLACATFVGYDAWTFRTALARNLSTQAQMIASYSGSALVFDDAAAAESTLGALKTAPAIISAHLYTEDGRVFASYWRDRAATPPAPAALPAGEVERFAFEPTSISLTRAVILDGRAVGTVYLRSDFQALYARIERYALLVGAALLTSLLTALVVSRFVRRGISRPVESIADLARRVAEENDYSMRAAAGGASSRELTTLVHSFNEMLARIQTRDRALEIARLELDDRVRARTAELNAINEELEAFTYSVSHDLRSPLRHVTGFASMLETHSGESLDDKGRHYLRTMIDAANRMGRLIDDLLAFSRMGRASLVPRPVDLAELVTEARAEVAAEANGRRVDWQIGPLPTVTADPALLRPVLVNLLSNAVKYTGTREVAQIELGAERSRQGEVVVYVRDNGVGFDMAYEKKLFGVFQRLHRADEFSGTGIGLANVRRIIQRHGGRTWAEGEVGRGATFYFSLPA